MEYSFNEFYGQISEDDKLVGEGQVLYSENLDLVGNSDFVTLSPKPENLFTTSDSVESFYYINRNINSSVFGDDDKNIFVDGELKYEADRSVLAFWSNSKYLYWIDSSKDIFRIELSDIGDTWDDTNVEETDTSLDSDTGKCYVVEGEGTTFIAYGTKLYEIDNSTGAVANGYFFLYDEVVGLLNSREYIEVVQADGVVFTWDKVSSTSSSYSLGMRVGFVAQLANKKFIIGEGVCYIVSGGAKTKIIGSCMSDVLEQDKFAITTNSNYNIGHLKDIFYVGSDSIRDIEDVDENFEFGIDSVLAIGTKKAGFSMGISKIINTASSGEKYKNIYGVMCSSNSMSSFDDKIYISYRDNENEYGVDIIDLSEQNTRTLREGLLILPKFDGGNKNIEKTLNRVGIRADFGNNAGNFYLYKVEGGELVPFNGDVNLSKFTYSEGMSKKRLTINENFFDITLAVVFNQTSDNFRNDALKLYSVTLDYEPTYKQ